VRGRYFGLPLIVLLISLNGCAPALKTAGESPLAAGEILRRVHERNEAVRTLKGEGTITVEAPEGSNTGFFTASLKKPDSLLVEFKGPFGIHVGTLLLSRQRFIFFNRMENRAVLGRPDGRTLQSMFKLRMDFDQILNAFTGEFPEASRGDTLSGPVAIEDNAYVLQYRNPAGGTEYRIDGETFVVRSYTVADTPGDPAVTATTERIDNSAPVPMPRFLRVIFPRERRSITIAYDDIETNKPVDCSFVLPARAQIIQR
jgi:outer membrane lipoprotein-sorting protein